jgi:hypothetical protein
MIEAENFSDSFPYLYAPPWALFPPFSRQDQMGELFPYFQDSERAILIVILAEIQRQILYPENPRLWELSGFPISLSSHHLWYMFPNRTQQETAIFWKVITTLGSLHLVRQNQEGPSCLYLFENPIFETFDGTHFTITVTVPRAHFSLLLGVSLHTPFQQGSPRIPTDPHPLFLWKPIWLDLSLTEKKRLFSFLPQQKKESHTELEEGGMYESAWQNCSLPTASGYTQSALVQWRSLKPLMRRLYDHGFFAPLPPEQSAYLPFSSTGMQVFWHRAQPTWEEKGKTQFYQRVAYLESYRSLHLPEWLETAGEGVPPSYRKNMWEKIVLPLRTQLTETMLSQYVEFPHGEMVPLLPLFLSCHMRAHPNHFSPLPADLQGWLQGDLLSLSTHTPSESIATFAARVTSHWPEFVALWQDKKMPTMITGEKTTRVSILPMKSSSMDRLQARKTLEEMRLHTQSDYTKLYKNYLASLDGKSRQLIATIQEQLQPQAFEEQITQRLVSYMLQQGERAN